MAFLAGLHSLSVYDHLWWNFTRFQFCVWVFQTDGSWSLLINFDDICTSTSSLVFNTRTLLVFSSD